MCIFSFLLFQAFLPFQPEALQQSQLDNTYDGRWKITNLQDEFSRCTTPTPSIDAGLRTLGEKWTVWVSACSSFDHFLELLILGWHDPVYAPGAPLVTHCNLWCWEITGAGRPGRHSQLARAPPVWWGHSQPQTDTLIFRSKFFIAF